jgi:hypothetical protein
MNELLPRFNFILTDLSFFPGFFSSTSPELLLGMYSYPFKIMVDFFGTT